MKTRLYLLIGLCVIITIIFIVITWFDRSRDTATLLRASQTGNATQVRNWLVAHRSTRLQRWHQVALLEAVRIASSYDRDTGTPLNNDRSTTAIYFAILESRPHPDDEVSRSILRYSVELGYANVLQALVARGANVNARDHSGWTPLMYAAMHGHPDVTRFLLRHGADPNLMALNNGQQVTALLLAKQTTGMDSLQDSRRRSTISILESFARPSNGAP